MPHPQALDPLPFGTRPLLRPGAEAVAYHISASLSENKSRNFKTTIALPQGSAWTSGLHFHTTHVEYLRLVAGSIFVELDGQTKFFSAVSGGRLPTSTGDLIQTGLVVEIPRYARHNWGRAEHYIKSDKSDYLNRHGKPAEDWLEEVIVEEWTEPSDIGKPLFFWNLNGVITTPNDRVFSVRQSLARSLLGSWWITFQLFVIFYELDNWPVFLSLTGGFRFYLGNSVGEWLGNSLEHFVTFAVLFTARAIARILQVSAVTQDRTPPELWEVYKRDGIEASQERQPKPRR